MGINVAEAYNLQSVRELAVRSMLVLCMSKVINGVGRSYIRVRLALLCTLCCNLMWVMSTEETNKLLGYQADAE
jgi:hypothetical protein